MLENLKTIGFFIILAIAIIFVMIFFNIFPQVGKFISILMLSIFSIGFVFYFLFMARRIEVLDIFKKDTEKKFKEHEEIITELRSQVADKVDKDPFDPNDEKTW